MRSKISAVKLLTELKQFTGTEQYLRINKQVVITDGVGYLAEEAGSWWLLDLFSSYLGTIDKIKHPFVCLTLNVNDSQAKTVIDDGNGNVLAEQEIEYTDFPLATIKLYACWAQKFWVVMLPSEY